MDSSVDAQDYCAFASGPGSRDITDREHEVLALLTQGMGDADIAKRLRISHRTVRTHVSSLFMKLDAANRTQAAIVGFLFHLSECAGCRRRARLYLSLRQ